MRFGFVAPIFDVHEFTELTALADQHGWDGAFIAESVWGTDAWVALGAAAMVTEQIRLGTLLTPPSRFRPWDLASRVATVDRLSRGRTILSAGMGALHEGWTAFEPDEGRRVRAEKMDECLEIFSALIQGRSEPFSGRHYDISSTDLFPPVPAIQQPRPPVWVVGAKVMGRDQQPSLDRAARWDGLLPQIIDPAGRAKTTEVETFAEIVADVRSRRTDLGLADQPFDAIIEADSSREFTQVEPQDPGAWAEVGATWWIESWWSVPSGAEGLAELRRRIEAGPPQL